MQDRYFGDVGDFGKYGLLRALCGLDSAPALKLGVVWYLFPDESHNADGKHLGYLLKPRGYRDCDEHLFGLLHSLIFDRKGQPIADGRTLKNAEAPGLFPVGTAFYAEPPAYPAKMVFQERARLRGCWYASALAATAAADLIFIDPDNGIECATSLTANKGPKYAAWAEIKGFVERGQSVVVYHHLGRNGTHAEQIESMAEEMRRRFPFHYVAALRFRRGSGRAYFILAARGHADILRHRLLHFMEGAWKLHFSSAHHLSNSVNLENLVIP